MAPPIASLRRRVLDIIHSASRELEWFAREAEYFLHELRRDTGNCGRFFEFSGGRSNLAVDVPVMFVVQAIVHQLGEQSDVCKLHLAVPLARFIVRPYPNKNQDVRFVIQADSAGQLSPQCCTSTGLTSKAPHIFVRQQKLKIEPLSNSDQGF